MLFRETGPLRFIIILIGALYHWGTKGFKGEFDEYMSGRFDKDVKYDRNFWTGVSVLIISAILIGIIGEWLM